MARCSEYDVLLTIGTWLFTLHFSPPAFYRFVHDYMNLNELGMTDDMFTEKVSKSWSEYLKMNTTDELITLLHARKGPQEVKLFKVKLDQDKENALGDYEIAKTNTAWEVVSRKK